MFDLRRARDTAFIAAGWHQNRAIERKEIAAQRLFFFWMLERLGLR